MHRFIICIVLRQLALPCAFLCCEPQYPVLSPQAPSAAFEIRFPDNQMRKGFLIRVQTDSTYKGSFPEDHFVLSIHQPPDKAKAVLDYRFVSSYMDYQVKAVDLTGDGVEEIIMITGTGRGTMVRRETLKVLQWNPSHLSTLLSVPFSDPCWTYKLEIIPKEQNELAHIALRLADTTVVGAFCDSSMLTKYSYLEYKWNRPKSRMILYKSIPENK